MVLAIIKKYKYNYNDYQDDCQNDSGGNRNSRSGPSSDDRHYPSVFLSVGRSQSAGSGPEAFAIALIWK